MDKGIDFFAPISNFLTPMYVQPELKTLEWWILRLMLDPLFLLISRLT